MSEVERLLAEQCPKGVPFRSLGDITKNFDSMRRPVTRAARIPGEFPYYGANGIQDRVDGYLFDGDFLLVGEDGSVLTKGGRPVVNWASGKIWVNNHAHVLQAKGEIELRFLYHYLQTVSIESLVTGGTQPKLNQRNLNLIAVATPPLVVQREIVAILDRMERLEAELEAELEARRRQYAYYRDALLTFDEAGGVRWVPMGELGEIFGGLSGKTKADFSNGNARFISYVNVYNNIGVNLTADDFVRVGPDERQRRLQRGDVLLTGSSESAADVAMSSVVTDDVREPLYLNSFCIGFRPHDSSLLDPQFSKHLLRSTGLRKALVKTGSGVTRFNVSKTRLAAVSLPIPPRDDQARIARTLNSLDALVNDLSSGLPAEIAVRRKQYEYYRDRLLTFEELAA